MQAAAKIILGIDPGTVVMGYGLIRVEGQKVTLLDLGVLKPGKIKDNYKRLQLIFNTVSGLITQYKPTAFAIEAPFLEERSEHAQTRKSTGRKYCSCHASWPGCNGVLS